MHEIMLALRGARKICHTSLQVGDRFFDRRFSGFLFLKIAQYEEGYFRV
jgi:hypothetical protein